MKTGAEAEKGVRQSLVCLACRFRPLFRHSESIPQGNFQTANGHRAWGMACCTWSIFPLLQG